MLSDSDIEHMVKEFYQSILRHENERRLSSDAPLLDQEREQRIAAYLELAANSRRDLANNAFDSVHLVTEAMLAKRFGLDAHVEKGDRRLAMQAMLRAGVDVAEALAARYRGDFNYEPHDKLLIAALQTAAQAPQAVEAAPPSVPSVAGTRKFSEVADEFRKAQLRQKKWERQTFLQAGATFKLFLEHAGDRPLNDYSKHDAATFKDLLDDLPADYSKAVAYKGLSAGEIVKRTKSDHDLTRLSPRTGQRHFSALSSLWEHAMQGSPALNPFQGWNFKARKRARDQRKMWETSHLEALFSTPVWKGCQSVARRLKPGSQILRDEKFWLPLIAVFSGMRQEEICQLHLCDIHNRDGVWIFEAEENDGKMLKNANAARKVPIHDQLIRLGLLTYAEQLRSKGEKRLFPNLKPGGADGRLGHNYSKWFTRYRRDVGLYDDKRDFHSLRHSATTFMRRADIDEGLVDEITGHEGSGETRRYTKSYTINQIKTAINAIDIGVDLSWLENGHSND